MYKHKCVCCNKNTNPTIIIQKYCSVTCRKLIEEQRKQLYSQKKVKKCKFCGKVFNVPRLSDDHFSETVYCSDDCKCLDFLL